MQLTRQTVSLGALAVLALAALLVPWDAVMAWAVATQREFQDAMARSLRAVRSGSPTAILSLCAATFAYGFVHALGPGHGKILLGGAALATQATLRRMVALSVVSALGQALMAILLVTALVGGVSLLSSTAAVDVVEEWLAPLSYALFAAIGGVIVARGMRLVAQARAPAPVCQSCGHAHGPAPEAVAELSSWRDSAALVFSVAVRPCSGALLLLAIAARLDVMMVGILAVLAMGLGTAAFNASVAASGVVARQLVHSGETASFQVTAGVLHLLGGAVIVAISLVMLLPLLG
ncbi:nickel/cobalt transporter [Jannaschia seohaensis]|uniref:Nickel/cobalt efflux system n=1 Tax=Jannaschia seohaensis TaxID=475081 RepID=A0A2Y9A147_9RHOB|nr:hypothetical protein [Jannaschia seohaensis]PWJ21737.1 ABC-type nickel/cobalt efflux system permease component RcnA [Jannaschia seohaensis]SSA38015.1 ABC-type nickel/cobalt efflux system, permease component RcnA [Jannaschia seohaensis]